MKRKAIVSISVVFGLCILILGGSHLYQRHLSSDLKREIIACFDPSGTDNDAQRYIHDARLLVRTRKDAEVLSKLERAADMARHSGAVRQGHLSQTQEDITAMIMGTDNTSKLIKIRSEYLQRHAGVPQELENSIRDSMASDKEATARGEQEWKDAVEEGKQALKLAQEVRADVGLPPLPEQAEDAARTKK